MAINPLIAELHALVSRLEGLVMKAREAKDVEDEPGLADALNEMEELVAALHLKLDRPP